MHKHFVCTGLKKPPSRSGRPRRVCRFRLWELQAKLNRWQAISLRLQGLTYQQIGDRLNRSKTTAHRYVWQELRLQD